MTKHKTTRALYATITGLLSGTLIGLPALPLMAGETQYKNEQVFQASTQHTDASNLVLGTGDDDTIVHSGTLTTWTHATGDLLFDLTDVDDEYIFRVGTDTAATGFEIRNDSDAAIFSVAGDGTVGALTLDGTNSLTFSVNEDAAAGTDQDPAVILLGGDGGTEIIRSDLKQDSSADLVYFQMGGGAAGTTRKSPTVLLGVPGETTASMDSTLRFEGSSDAGVNRTATIVHRGQERDLTITASNSLVLSDGTGSRTSTAGAVSHAGVTTYELDASGAVTIESSAGALSLGADNIAQAVNVATAGARPVLIGSAAAASVGIDAGVGAGSFQADTTMTVQGGGISQYGDDVAKLRYDGIGALSLTGVTTLDLDASGAASLESSAGAINVGNDAVAQAVNIATGAAARAILIGNAASASLGLDSGVGALSLTSDVSSTWQVSGNAVGNQTLTIDAVNAGAGEGRLSLNADEQVDLNDGTLTLTMDGGNLSETALVDLDFTGSGTTTIRGGGISLYGDDVGYLSFDGLGALSEVALTSFGMTPSGAITLTAGAASTWSTSSGALGLTSADAATWQVSGNAAGNLTLTLDAVNAGAGEGRLALNADEQIDLNDGTATLTLDGGALTETSLASADITPSGAITLRGGAVSTFGDDTGFLSFDGAGAQTTSGLVSSSITPSAALTLTAGAASVWGSLDVTAGGATAATAAVTLETGDRTKTDADAGVPTSGILTLRSGATSQTTLAATGGASGAVAVRSGATDVTVAGGTGGASGQMTSKSGDTDISAGVAATGGASGAWVGGSGDALSTGATATSGASGNATLETGTSADANTGTLTIRTGAPAATGTSGNVAISSGSASGAGTSGNISMTVGSAPGGTTGTIQLAGKVDLTTSGAVTATGNPAINLGTNTTQVGALNLGADVAWTRTGAGDSQLAARLRITDDVVGGTARIVGGRAYNAVAASTAITGATETEAVFDSSYAIPADTLKAATHMHIAWQGIHTATTGAETHDILVKLGSTTIMSKTGINPADNDQFAGDCDVTIRTDGAGGTMVAKCSATFGPNGGATSVAENFYLASTAINTTGILTAGIAIDRQAGATDGDSARLDIMYVSID